MKQFLRSYKLYITGPKYTVYEGSSNVEARLIEDPIHIQFDITKTILRDPNMAEITLWNLSPDTEREIIQEGTQVILEAGYDEPGIIFKGQVFQPLRGKLNGTDYFLKLICLDGDAYLNLAFISGTLQSNQTRQQLAQQVLRDSTVDLDSVVMDNLTNTNFIDGSISTNERGKVVFGDPSKYLNNMAKMGNSTFYIDNNEARFFNPTVTNSEINNAHLIDTTTGMIGVPQQVDYGVEVTTLLNPSIRLGDFIKIDNRSVLQQQFNFGQIPYLLDNDGTYRVIKIHYSGDSRGQDWYSRLTTITQGGVIPSMLIGSTGSMIL